jgi:hypothetical protein
VWGASPRAGRPFIVSGYKVKWPEAVERFKGSRLEGAGYQEEEAVTLGVAYWWPRCSSATAQGRSRRGSGQLRPCPKVEERWPAGSVLGHKAEWASSCRQK